VVKADDCIALEVKKLVATLLDGGVLLLENVRFYKEEENNDPAFVKEVSSLTYLYVNDAFGTAHTELMTPPRESQSYFSHMLLVSFF
ncbi:phosphoglycerate kinase, chloroplastic, partial [Tanacetum coccineum]